MKDNKTNEFSNGEQEIDKAKFDLKKEIKSWVKSILLALTCAYFITHFVIVNAQVPTGSMKNTIMPNDRLIANRLAYTFFDVERGDVIVFPYPDDPSILFVKRVIGLPGDVVEIIDGDVYINGQYYEENYVSSEIIDKTRNSGPYIVPDNHLFMMGDNRQNSEDSRYWENTYLDKDDIVGKAVFQYWPNISLIK